MSFQIYGIGRIPDGFSVVMTVFYGDGTLLQTRVLLDNIYSTANGSWFGFVSFQTPKSVGKTISESGYVRIGLTNYTQKSAWDVTISGCFLGFGFKKHPFIKTDHAHDIAQMAPYYEVLEFEDYSPICNLVKDTTNAFGVIHHAEKIKSNTSVSFIGDVNDVEAVYPLVPITSFAVQPGSCCKQSFSLSFAGAFVERSYILRVKQGRNLKILISV